MKVEKILYSENKAKIKDVELNFDYCKNLIQNAVNEFDKLNVSIDIKELENLFDNRTRVLRVDSLDELLRSKLVEGKEGNFKGLKLNTERLKELIELPKIDGLIEVLIRFKNLIPSETITADDVVYWGFYSIVKGKVQIQKDAFELITQSYKAYAETKEEKERLNDVLKLCNALTSFYASNPDLHPVEIINSKLIEFGNNNEFLPSPHFIHTGII